MVMKMFEIGRPVVILAPMVNHSDLAYRIMAKKYGADICYSEMVHCKHFLATKADIYNNNWYSTIPSLKILEDPSISSFLSHKDFSSCLGFDSSYETNLQNLLSAEEAFKKTDFNQIIANKSFDSEICRIHPFEKINEIKKAVENYRLKDLSRPQKYVLSLISNLEEVFGQGLHVFPIYRFFHELSLPFVVQICGNNPELMLEAAKRIQPVCDGIDINFGCPQNIARKGFYGSFLQEDRHLTQKIIQILTSNLEVPVSCKIRILNNLSDTLNYTKMMENVGARFIAVHSRTRDQKGQITGLADLSVTRNIKMNANIPIITNGNVRNSQDICDNLEYTKADGFMVAESHLYNPKIFHEYKKSQQSKFINKLSNSEVYAFNDQLSSVFAIPNDETNSIKVALEYLSYCAIFKTKGIEIKSHLHKILLNTLTNQEREDLSKMKNLESIRAFLIKISEQKKEEGDNNSLKPRIRALEIENTIKTDEMSI